MAGRDEEFKRQIRDAGAVAGGKLLGGPQAEQVDPRTLRSQHRTVFRNCGLDIGQANDPEGKVLGWHLVIEDLVENRTYIMPIQTDETRLAMIAALEALTPLGEVDPDIAKNEAEGLTQDGQVLQ